jgi:hypothetical protein
MIVKIQFSNSNHNFEYDLDNNTNILQIKTLISNENSITFSNNEIRLIYSGRVLENYKTLENINFQNNHTIIAIGKQNDNLENQQEAGLIEKMFENDEVVISLLNSFNSVVNSLEENVITHIRNNSEFASIDDIDQNEINNFINLYHKILNKMVNDSEYLELVRRRDVNGFIIRNSNSITDESYKNICNRLYQFISLFNNDYQNAIVKITLNNYKNQNPQLNESTNNEIIKDIILKMNELYPNNSEDINAIIEINIIDFVAQNNSEDESDESEQDVSEQESQHESEQEQESQHESEQEQESQHESEQEQESQHESEQEQESQHESDEEQEQEQNVEQEQEELLEDLNTILENQMIKETENVIYIQKVMLFIFVIYCYILYRFVYS